MCAGGSGPTHHQSVGEIAHELGIHVITLYKWRKAWRLPRLAGARRIRAGPERLRAPDAAAQAHPPHPGLAAALIGTPSLVALQPMSEGQG